MYILLLLIMTFTVNTDKIIFSLSLFLYCQYHFIIISFILQFIFFYDQSEAMASKQREESKSVKDVQLEHKR